MVIDMGLAMQVLAFLAVAFIFVVGSAVLAALVLFVVDRIQTGDAIGRTYPVPGRLRARGRAVIE